MLPFSNRSKYSSEYPLYGILLLLRLWWLFVVSSWSSRDIAEIEEGKKEINFVSNPASSHKLNFNPELFFLRFHVACALGEKLFRFVQLHKKQSRRRSGGETRHQHENHVSSLKRCRRKHPHLRLTLPSTHHSALNWKRWKIKTKSLSRVKLQRQERGSEKSLV